MPMTAVAPAAAGAAAILVAEAESLNTMDSLSRTVGRCCSPASGASVRSAEDQNESPLIRSHNYSIEGLYQAISSTAQRLDAVGPELLPQIADVDIDDV